MKDGLIYEIKTRGIKSHFLNMKGESDREGERIILRESLNFKQGKRSH